MGLGSTARPSLAHRWNSNRELLNLTVLISPYEKQKIQYMKSKNLIVAFSSGVHLAGVSHSEHWGITPPLKSTTPFFLSTPP